MSSLDIAVSETDLTADVTEHDVFREGDINFQCFPLSVAGIVRGDIQVLREV